MGSHRVGYDWSDLAAAAAVSTMRPPSIYLISLQRPHLQKHCQCLSLCLWSCLIFLDNYGCQLGTFSGPLMMRLRLHYFWNVYFLFINFYWSIILQKIKKNLLGYTGIKVHYVNLGASRVLLVVKNLPTNAGDIVICRFYPWSGRSPGRGHNNPFQNSPWRITKYRGTWCSP